MNSSRLPGKILMNAGGKSILDHIFFRLTFLKHKSKIVLATTASPADDIVEDYCTKKNISCFRGSETNVLERYYLCAEQYEFKNIIRITGDNPFVDVEEIDNLIDFYFSEKLDYANSFNALPVGAGAEIFSFAALEKSYREGKLPHHVEHVNEYMIEHPELFATKTFAVAPSKNRADIRLTVDTPEDIRKADYIVRNSVNEYITTQEAIQLCSQFA